MIDRYNLFRAEEDRRADRHLPDRAAAPDRDRVTGLNVGLHCRLPAGREDVGEEQQLLVVDAVGHLDVRRVGERYPQILGLPAGITAGEVRVAKKARRPVAKNLVAQFALPVRPLAYREVAAPALVAFTALDREGDDDAVALLERALRRA